MNLFEKQKFQKQMQRTNMDSKGIRVDGMNWKIGIDIYTLFIVVQSLNHVRFFCDPMDFSPPVSCIYEISQARILEWVAISFSRDLPDPRIKSVSLAGGLAGDNQQALANRQSSCWQAVSLPLSHQGSPFTIDTIYKIGN